MLTHPETHPAANAQSQSIQRFNHQATTGSNNPSGRECSSSGVCCNPCPPLFFNPDCLLSDSNHPRPICNYNTVTTGRQRAHCVCVTCVVLSHTHGTHAAASTSIYNCTVMAPSTHTGSSRPLCSVHTHIHKLSLPQAMCCCQPVPNIMQVCQLPSASLHPVIALPNTTPTHDSVAENPSHAYARWPELRLLQRTHQVTPGCPQSPAKPSVCAKHVPYKQSCAVQAHARCKAGVPKSTAPSNTFR